MDELQLLVLIAPRSLKDDIVDTLMTQATISGFTLTDAAGYSREHSHFDLGEQVEGYRSCVRFEVLHAPEERAALCSALAETGGGEGLRYWVTGLVEQGHLCGESSSPERPGE